MGGRLNERCERICGSDFEHCFIANRRQIECIADMVINKVFGISALIETALEEDQPGVLHEKLDRAMRNSRELINWVKFLQVAHDLRTLRTIGAAPETREQRREARYPVPEEAGRYLGLKVDKGDTLRRVRLTNFSRTGMQFRSPEPLEQGVLYRCVLSTEHTIRQEVVLAVSVKYCTAEGEEFLVGVSIEEVSDRPSLDFFQNMIDFIASVP